MDNPISANFQWINSCATHPPTDRALLRKSVMQKVALRRKLLLSEKPHPNRRQFPVFLLEDDLANQGENPKHSKGPGNVETVQFERSNLNIIASNNRCMSANQRLAPALGATCPPMLAKCSLDFLDLSILASHEVGRFTGRKLLENPQRLPHFLGRKTWSYCQYVPLYYSQSILIRNAVDCAVARARCLLSPSNIQWEHLAVSSYTQALSSLQNAIDFTSKNLTTELLCATQILALYEMLNPTRGDAWIKHAAGAACIIRLRGPKSYSTDFEQSLLMSHVGPMITESILDNQSCFLEQPAWREVLQSISTENTLQPERSAMVISLLKLLISVPRLFRDITAAICCGPPYMMPETLEKLVFRARELRSSLQRWHSKNLEPPNNPTNASTGFRANYSQIMVLYNICTIYSNRLNTSIYRLGELPEILNMEDESQRCASSIVSLCGEEEAYCKLQRSLLLVQKLPLAEAVISTAKEWKTRLTLDMDRYQQFFLMPKQTFQHWCDLFGRRTV